MNARSDVLARLMQVIQERKAHPRENSYTNRLLAGGVERIGAKVLEEAGEVVEAAAESDDPDRQHLIAEAADLLYHLLVLLGHCDVEFSRVEAELARRFGVSGLDEKAARGSSGESGD